MHSKPIKVKLPCLMSHQALTCGILDGQSAMKQLQNKRSFKGDVRPFMMSIDKAVSHLVKCIQKKPIRYTAPYGVIPLVKLRSWLLRLSIMCSKLRT
jgi:hypothetical protein